MARLYGFFGWVLLVCLSTLTGLFVIAEVILPILPGVIRAVLPPDAIAQWKVVTYLFIVPFLTGSGFIVVILIVQLGYRIMNFADPVTWVRWVYVGGTEYKPPSAWVAESPSRRTSFLVFFLVFFAGAWIAGLPPTPPSSFLYPSLTEISFNSDHSFRLFWPVEIFVHN